jgi:hypothetical protein
MNGDRSGGAHDDGDTGSWTTETLPLSLRKELLDRELRKLGFRKGGSHEGGSAQQQQSPGGSSHPSADGDSADHGD